MHYAKIMQIMQVSKNYANYASPTLQPVVKPNRKCCVNGKVESGALKISFFGSESLLHRVVQERWNTRVFQRSFLYTLVAGLRETS